MSRSRLQCLSWTGTELPPENIFHSIGICPGNGRYIGLTYVTQVEVSADDSVTTLRGLIFEGEPSVQIVPVASQS